MRALASALPWTRFQTPANAPASRLRARRAAGGGPAPPQTLPGACLGPSDPTVLGGVKDSASVRMEQSSVVEVSRRAPNGRRWTRGRKTGSRRRSRGRRARGAPTLVRQGQLCGRDRASGREREFFSGGASRWSSDALGCQPWGDSRVFRLRVSRGSADLLRNFALKVELALLRQCVHLRSNDNDTAKNLCAATTTTLLKTSFMCERQSAPAALHGRRVLAERSDRAPCG